MFGLLVTRDDDLLVRQWFARHAPLFEKLAVLDGSRTSLTHEIARTYPNVIYARDPEGGEINDQTLRSACYGLLAPYVTAGDWIVICHVDEFFYHAPDKVAAAATEAGVDSVVWQALHILPHTDEQSAIAQSLETTGSYDPVALLHHFWYKYDPERDNYGATRELRMFRVPEGGVTWGNFNGWVGPVNLAGIPLDLTKGGVRKRFNRPSRLKLFPTYFHYKLFNLGPEHFNSKAGHFEKSRLGTGLGGRRIHSFDDCFFSAERPWSQKNHSMVERFDGILPDDHIFNTLGNGFRLGG